MGKRLRDPVHGLIVFDENKPIDMLAWSLIDTPEFQRLRRIRQLGVSKFTLATWLSAIVLPLLAWSIDSGRGAKNDPTSLKLA